MAREAEWKGHLADLVVPTSTKIRSYGQATIRWDITRGDGEWG